MVCRVARSCAFSLSISSSCCSRQHDIVQRILRLLQVVLCFLELILNLFNFHFGSLILIHEHGFHRGAADNILPAADMTSRFRFSIFEEESSVAMCSTALVSTLTTGTERKDFSSAFSACNCSLTFDKVSRSQKEKIFIFQMFRGGRLPTSRTADMTNSLSFFRVAGRIALHASPVARRP